ncbi:uncharacterized protein LOC118281137 [Spodoptera frugiperda]|uniref:Uncharacterized protein LOC118281137 n=1 Tax=Spodoptera frugiperda TaxID=7108 RepID=A0A9R0ESX8_SPOFR|nr:uncharacterized protein LOC118281137 [Spodoptera frugiperda]
MEESKVITRGTSTSSSTVDNTSTQTAQQTIVAHTQRTDQRLNQCPSDPLEKQSDQLYDPTLFKPRSKIKELLFCGSYSKNMCRLCLSLDRELYAIKYPMLATVVRVITGDEMDFRPWNYPPSYACMECNDRIDDFSTFRCDARIANLNLMSGIRYVAGIAPDPETWESD